VVADQFLAGALLSILLPIALVAAVTLYWTLYLRRKS
jgi:hypothetical protein